MKQIQMILHIPSYRNQYWMKDGDEPAKRISKDKWFQLYDTGNVEVLAPLTKEKQNEK